MENSIQQKEMKYQYLHTNKETNKIYKAKIERIKGITHPTAHWPIFCVPEKNGQEVGEGGLTR